MSVLASAVGAILAAILEASVLTHLAVGGVTPDLVFAVGIAVAMVLGFDAGMTWALAGGVMLDILMPERVLGSTAITLVLVIGVALLIARATWPPRVSVIAATAFGLSLVYQLLLLFVLGVTSGVTWAGISITDLLVTALLNMIVAIPAVFVARALDLRFGEPERVAW
jgi:rod shape-determining protein MreD